jgi:hypothetical protein
MSLIEVPLRRKQFWVTKEGINTFHERLERVSELLGKKFEGVVEPETETQCFGLGGNRISEVGEVAPMLEA